MIIVLDSHFHDHYEMTITHVVVNNKLPLRLAGFQCWRLLVFHVGSQWILLEEWPPKYVYVMYVMYVWFLYNMYILYIIYIIIVYRYI